MCGIAGYVGPRADSAHLVVECLKKLEYRGYDSAGVALVSESGDQPITVMKREGKLRNLEAHMTDFPHTGGTAIAHTRWATHGRPSDRNSHPQCDCDNRIALVHNGIIENYLVLKEMLAAKGHRLHQRHRYRSAGASDRGAL